MRIEQTVDALQGQVGLQPRAAAPPPEGAPRRVQAVGQVQYGEDKANVGQAPGDAVTLDLSPEGREAARQAAIDEYQKKLRHSDGGEPERQVEKSDQRKIEELRERDRQVRAHEQAVRAAAGGLSAGTRYSYQVGPDGRLYVVEGDVQCDMSEIPGDPEATLHKAEQLQRAASASGDTSPQDRLVAAEAAMMASRARQALRQQKAEKDPGDEAAEAKVADA